MYLRSRSELAGLHWLPAGTPPDLVLGQGADLFAFPLGRLLEARRFFTCAVGLDRRISRHDDFWISAYLKLVHNMSIVRVPGMRDHSVDGAGSSVSVSYVKNATRSGATGRIDRRARRK